MTTERDPRDSEPGLRSFAAAPGGPRPAAPRPARPAGRWPVRPPCTVTDFLLPANRLALPAFSVQGVGMMVGC